MNRAQVFSLLRTLATIGLTWLVSSGKLTQDQATSLMNGLTEAGPVLVIVGTVVYGLWKKSPTNLVKDAKDMASGVEVRVDPLKAPQALVDVANDPTVSGVSLKR